MGAPAKPQVDSAMNQALALQPVAHSHFDHQIYGALLKDAGSDPLFAILAAARFQNHRFDTAKVEQLREHEPRGTRADDSNLRPHPRTLIRNQRGRQAARLNIEAEYRGRIYLRSAHRMRAAKVSTRTQHHTTRFRCMYNASRRETYAG